MANPLDDLKKVGEAKLKVLFWDVYNSSLYSKTGEYQAEQFPQALKINYLRDIDAKDLREPLITRFQLISCRNQISINFCLVLR